MYKRQTFSRVGLSEQEATQQGYDVKIAKLPTAAIPRANVDSKPEGILKAIIDKKTDAILGCVLLCERSEEMINFVQLAMNQNMKYQDIANHIFTHPVSYTHLDVYKRQALIFILDFLLMMSSVVRTSNIIAPATLAQFFTPLRFRSVFV